jgi:hypothetical protein
VGGFGITRNLIDAEAGSELLDKASALLKFAQPIGIKWDGLELSASLK